VVWTKGLTGILATVWLVGCAAEPPGEPERTGLARAAVVSLDRPCSLITPAVAEELSGRPHFRTLVADFVSGAHVTCAQAVGAGGVQSVARIVVHLPAGSASPELLFAGLCRGDLPSAAPGAPVPPGAPPAAEGMAGEGRPGICIAPSGARVVLSGDRVFEAVWERSVGGIDPALSEALAVELADRVRGRQLALFQERI
jgi:hypothetical protein